MVLKSKDDQVTVIGAGVTLHEALAAAEQLRKGDLFFFFFFTLSFTTAKKSILVNLTAHPLYWLNINYQNVTDSWSPAS